MTWSIGVATGSCITRPVLEVLDTLKAAEVPGVEIGTLPRHFDYLAPDLVAAVAARLRALAIAPVSIHAPFGPSFDLADHHERRREEARDAILASARALKQLGGRIVVAHPSDLTRHGADIGAHLDHAAAGLRAVALACRDEGLQLAIESPLPHLIGGHPDEFDFIVRHVGDAAGVCLDTGHVSLGRAWRRFMDVAAGRLVHVHASDNHGQFDDHLPPGEGSIDWREILTSLRDARFAGWMILELGCPPCDGASAFFAGALTRARALAGTWPREEGAHSLQ
jgi:sugar phosphate isomerase/epimerase